MNPVVVIPTFIYPRRHRGGADVVSTYDHPTAPNQEGELGRCLESLAKVEGLGLVVILVSADVSLEVQAAEKVQAIANRHPDVTTLVIGAAELALIEQRMAQQNIERLSKEIGLQGYGAIRNLGLLVANVLGFDAVVFLDDDEVIDDPKFLEKAMYGLGKLTRQGVPIVAKTGYYLNDQDSYLSKWEDKWYNRFWQQGRAFNEWITKAMRGPRLSRSNHRPTRCAAAAWPSTRRRSGASPSTRGSPAARTWTTCLTCACMARISGSTTSGSCVTCPRAPQARARVSARTSSDGSTSTASWNTPERSSTFSR